MEQPSLQDVGLAVRKLQWRHHRCANHKLAALGVSLAQWDVLRQLYAHPDASLHELAQLTSQTDQSIGTLAVRMIDRNLLQRLSGPGRAVQHQLTSEGEAVRTAGADILNEVLAATIGKLPASDLTVLFQLLTTAAADAGCTGLTRPNHASTLPSAHTRT